MRELNCKLIQCDEIWSFVGTKQRNVSEEKMAERIYPYLGVWKRREGYLPHIRTVELSGHMGHPFFSGQVILSLLFQGCGTKMSNYLTGARPWLIKSGSLCFLTGRGTT